MDQDSIRTGIDVDEHSPQTPKQRLTLDKPIVRSTGKPVRLTN